MPYVDIFLGGREFYLPSEPSGPSLKKTVQDAFRRPQPAPIDDPIDTAFAASRFLSSLLASSRNLKLTTDDGPAAPAKKKRGRPTSKAAWIRKTGFAAGAVQRVTDLAPGTLLLSHPVLEGEFERSVILLAHHSPAGSYGLRINRPTPLRGRHLAEFVDATREIYAAQQKAMRGGDGAQGAASAVEAPAAEDDDASESESEDLSPEEFQKELSELVSISTSKREKKEGPKTNAVIFTPASGGAEGEGDLAIRSTVELRAGPATESRGESEGAARPDATQLVLHAPRALLDVLRDQTILSGGPIPAVQVLHRCPGVPLALPLPGSAMRVGGDWAGPLQRDEVQSKDLRMCVGEAAWAGGQLDAEMRKGVWLAVRAPLDQIERILFTPGAGAYGKTGPKRAGLGAAEAEEAAAAPPTQPLQPTMPEDLLYEGLLSGLPEAYARLLRIPKPSERGGPEPGAPSMKLELELGIPAEPGSG